MIQVNNLSFDYAERSLLTNLHFNLQSGQCLHIVGKNGVGKSTLLKLVVGLIPPHVGDILWQGVSIHACMQAYLAQLAYVGHHNGLSEALTLEENLRLDWHQGRTNRTLAEGAEMLQLMPFMERPLACLSKGQQRKAALLRLWMTDAPLWVLDEPFTALDEGSQTVIWAWIHAHRASGGSVLMTSHLGVKKGHDVNVIALS